MTAAVAVPFDDDEPPEAALAEPVFAEGPRPACPLGARVGCTCQTAFEWAYAAHGFPASYSRAVLIKLTAQPKPRTLMPKIVARWFDRGPAAAASERCIGCSLTAQGKRELQATYQDQIHRDVTIDVLREHAVNERPRYEGVTELAELSESDLVLRDLITSGALLDDGVDGLGALLRGDV